MIQRKPRNAAVSCFLNLQAITRNGGNVCHTGTVAYANPHGKARAAGRKLEIRKVFWLNIRQRHIWHRARHQLSRWPSKNKTQACYNFVCPAFDNLRNNHGAGLCAGDHAPKSFQVGFFTTKSDGEGKGGRNQTSILTAKEDACEITIAFCHNGYAVSGL